MFLRHCRRTEGICKHFCERWIMWMKDKDHNLSLHGVTSHILNPKSSSGKTCGSNCLSFFITSIKTLLLISFYYVFSIGLTFYNRWLFKDFHYPLITTSTHFLTAFVLCGFSRLIMSYCKRDVPTLSWDVYAKRVFLTGLASALDIGLSNWSFVFITVSLYTMVKSSAVIFILAFAILLKLEKARWSLIFVVILIATGLFLFVYESTQFNLEGFILVLIAAFIGGLRWTLSQILTQKQELGLKNPINLMWHLQPTMFIGLFPLAVGLEGISFFTSEKIFAADVILNQTPILLKILLGGIVAFFLGFSEYLLLSNTSSLTLSICGIFKEICTLLLASRYNGDRLTTMNWIGFAVCICGIILHVFLKNRAESKPEETSENITMNLLGGDLASTAEESSEDEIFDARNR
uniref:solute carrier family 35 member C2-like isoform X2 n=1 Tax=Styela clava TaxID=7725 RepID=UPI001939D5A0|nr:solute carrier family 35 member C2-like isoform X2 [Styela clava]